LAAVRSIISEEKKAPDDCVDTEISGLQGEHWMPCLTISQVNAVILRWLSDPAR
jgi:hypothetical protein